jgi:hypothetical protein
MESLRKAILKRLKAGSGPGLRVYVILTVALIIMSAGLTGELLAIFALYFRSPDRAIEVIVLVCLCVLVLAVLSVLYVKYFIAFVGPVIQALKPLFEEAFNTAATMARPAVEYALKAVTDDASKAAEGKDRAPESSDADQTDKKSPQEDS